MMVVSDLHAFSGSYDDASPSLMAVGGGENRGERLLADAAEIVSNKFDSVAGLLVAGDITNQADGAALKEAWRHLNTAANALDARLFATAGNHDYDSRGSGGSSSTPKGSLLDLDPPFPFRSESTRLQYFAYDFAYEGVDDFAVLSVNSAAQHGYRSGEEEEYDFGRITASTVARIKVFLLGVGKPLPKILVLLVHHHIARIPGIDSDDPSILRGGEDLLDMLGEFGDWFVVHGHKHRPWIQTGGGSAPPTVFSAGSFAVGLSGPVFSDSSRHQFYVIEFEVPPEVGVAGGQVFGNIHAWTNSVIGWSPSGVNDGMPSRSGFGHRPHIGQLVQSIQVEVSKRGLLNSTEIEIIEPRLKYMHYQDINLLVRRLKAADENLHLEVDSNGYLDEISTDANLDSE